MKDTQKLIKSAKEFMASGHWQNEQTALINGLINALEEANRENERLQQVNHLYGAFIAELSDTTADSIADQCRNVLKQGGEVSRDVQDR